MYKLILVVNPVSDSTKIAIFKNRKEVFLVNIKHQLEILTSFERIADQYEYRKSMILSEIAKSGIELKEIDIVVARGGLLKPVLGGVYRVNKSMIRDIKNPLGEHESNLGGLIAYEISKEIGPKIKAIIVDPTYVDEMDDVARISGVPELPRRSLMNALNQRAVAQNFAKQIGRNYKEINVIVAHLGRGVSIGAHQKGRIIDVNNWLNGDGPMSPERSGGVPSGQLVEMCFSGKFSKQEILKKLKGKGGLIAYLGTSDAIEIESRIDKGDKQAELVFTALAYQVAKEIGSMSTVLKGEVDGILLAGGLAYSNFIVDEVSSRVKHIGLIRTYPGDGEMESLAMNGYMALIGELDVNEYS